jgi:hypothetical protein
LRAEHEELNDGVVSGPLGNQLSSPVVMQVNRETVLLQTKRKHELSMQSEVNKPILMESANCLYSCHKNSRTLSILSVNRLSYFTKAKICDLGGSLIYSFFLSALTFCLHQESRSRVKETIIISAGG